jgi:metal-dependent amidase/aminoacylase/carboxypeptidase family protein
LFATLTICEQAVGGLRSNVIATNETEAEVMVAVVTGIAELKEEVTGWRRHPHKIPEIGFDLFKTAAFVASKPTEFGCDEVATTVGRTASSASFMAGLAPALLLA